MSAFDQPPREVGSLAKQTATLSLSARYRQGSLAESFYLSTQYADLMPWEADAPMARKRPREIVPLYKTIVDTVRRFIWSGDRFPRVAVNPTVDPEDDDGDEIGPRLDPEQAKKLESFVRTLIDTARLDRCAKEMSTSALITTSCAVIIGLKGGFVSYHVEPGKHCTPTFCDDNPRAVKSLEILYQVAPPDLPASSPPHMRGSRGQLFWIRRVIDEESDTLFKPVEVRPGIMPDWFVQQKVDHKLGFCPVKWVRTMPSSVNDIDGQPVIDPALYPLISRINYLYSQAARSLEYALDPQWVRKNVGEDMQGALAKHPGKVWDIEDIDSERKAEISILEAKGTGIERAGELLADLRSRICEACSVVLSDPHKMAGKAMSGVVLEYLNAPMISLAADLRRDLGSDGLCGVVNLALRIVATTVRMGGDVWVPGVKKIVDIMEEAQLAGVWLDFPLDIQWPKYFAPSAQDVGFAVQAATAAKDGALIGKHAATRFVSEYFAVTDVAAEVDMVSDEKDEAQTHAMETASAMAQVSGVDPVDDTSALAVKPKAKAKSDKKLKPISRTTKSKA